MNLSILVEVKTILNGYIWWNPQHIKGNLKKSILRSTIRDVFTVFYLSVIGHVDLVKSQNITGCTGRDGAFLVLKSRLTARVSKTIIFKGTFQTIQSTTGLATVVTEYGPWLFT